MSLSSDRLLKLGRFVLISANVLMLAATGDWDIYITTPEGRDYHSSEFADLPRTPAVARAHRKTRPSDKPIPISRTVR